MITLNRLPGTRSAMALLVLVLLFGCGDHNSGGNNGVGARTTSSLSSSDKSIIAKVYNGSRTPVGFYNESLPVDKFYIINHIKNTQLMSAPIPSGVSQYQLCTDDFNEAMTWSETAAAKMPVYRTIIENSDTDLYYQFTRMDTQTPQFIQLDRVFKCSFLDRSQPNDSLGQLNRMPIEAQDVRLVVEYLWIFSQYNNYGNTVLSTVTEENESTISHTLREARLIQHTNEECDLIKIFESRYRVDRQTGTITLHQTLEREIPVQTGDASCS